MGTRASAIQFMGHKLDDLIPPVTCTWVDSTRLTNPRFNTPESAPLSQCLNPNVKLMQLQRAKLLYERERGSVEPRSTHK